MSVATRARRAMPNGWWGVLILIASEAALFGTLIGTYFYLRFNSTSWPPPGLEKPEIATPTVLTAILVLTSLPMLVARRAARAGRLATVRACLWGAVVVQCAYLGYQVHAFADELTRHSPRDGAYSSIYFTLVGAHHAHVLVGILLSIGLGLKLTRGLTHYRVVGTRAVSLYWHFTNAIAVFVLLTQIYPAL